MPRPSTSRMCYILRALNIVVFVVFVLAALTVDGNGRVFGMNEVVSTVTSGALWMLCFVLGTALAIFDGAWRIPAITFLLVYAVLLLPLVLS